MRRRFRNEMQRYLSADEPRPSGTSAADSGMAVSRDRIPVDAEYWLALTRLPGIGRVSYLRILQTYQSPRVAWEHSDADWRRAELVRAGFDSGGVRAEALAWAKTQVDKLAKSDWSMVVLGDTEFPAQLAALDHPPPYLFTRGIGFRPPAIAVVGGRHVTDYGVRVTKQITSGLASSGVTIVSGFARGIDTVAHTAALDAGGTTVAVWGCGPDVVYPPENRNLADRVAAQGLIATEFPFGAAPERHHFPIRNRLIAGFADGVLVTQARRKSGALLTALHALEQGKNVYAIPGEVGNDQFVGSHELLKEGGRIVTHADDILADFQIAPAKASPAVTRPLPPMSDIERRVYEALGGTPCHVDRLAVSLGLSAGECVRVLVALELKDLARQTAGSMFSRPS